MIWLGGLFRLRSPTIHSHDATWVEALATTYAERAPRIA